jgi:hypothetical protein
MKITRKHNIKNKYVAMIYDTLLFVVFAVFELINWRHFTDTWNNKPRYTLIKIYGLRTALVDDVSQRKRSKFLFKIGKYYI